MAKKSTPQPPSYNDWCTGCGAYTPHGYLTDGMTRTGAYCATCNPKGA